MTFLDIVRRLGELTQQACDPECSPGLHRREAANHIGILIANPSLVEAIHEIVEQRAINAYIADMFGKES